MEVGAAVVDQVEEEEVASVDLILNVQQLLLIVPNLAIVVQNQAMLMVDLVLQQIRMQGNAPQTRVVQIGLHIVLNLDFVKRLLNMGLVDLVVGVGEAVVKNKQRDI